MAFTQAQHASFAEPARLLFRFACGACASVCLGTLHQADGRLSAHPQTARPTRLFATPFAVASPCQAMPLPPLSRPPPRICHAGSCPASTRTHGVPTSSTRGGACTCSTPHAQDPLRNQPALPQPFARQTGLPSMPPFSPACRPAPCRPAPCRPAPCRPAPCRPAPCRPAPCRPVPCRPAPCRLPHAGLPHAGRLHAGRPHAGLPHATKLVQLSCLPLAHPPCSPTCPAHPPCSSRSGALPL
jgi:hypothetical protein